MVEEEALKEEALEEEEIEEEALEYSKAAHNSVSDKTCQLLHLYSQLSDQLLHRLLGNY